MEPRFLPTPNHEDPDLVRVPFQDIRLHPAGVFGPLGRSGCRSIGRIFGETSPVHSHTNRLHSVPRAPATVGMQWTSASRQHMPLNSNG